MGKAALIVVILDRNGGVTYADQEGLVYEDSVLQTAGLPTYTWPPTYWLRVSTHLLW